MLRRTVMAIICLSGTLAVAWAQPPGDEPRPPQRPGPGPGGPIFFGGPMAPERKLVAEFDRDGDGKLNRTERQAARAFLKKERESRPGGFGPMGRGGPGGPPGGPPGGGFGPPGMFATEPGKPGPRVSPGDVKPLASQDLYDPNVLRTLFLDFEEQDWEEELADFYHTDVEVPATLTVDGKKYPGVGVHFRGASSYFTVRAGSKRSLNVSVDFTDEKQRLYGRKTLNLLNSHEDASMMSTVLYSELARKHLPTPRANFAKVVINGESWGVYVNVEQFNKEFTKENFGSTQGARWKVKGRPGGRGGLEFHGEKLADYRRHYEIKSKDDEKDWKRLIHLCRTLNETPVDQLEEKLRGLLDVDGVLWFLAYDVALINGDGYWVRASDYSLYLDGKGVFHVIPHDMNEAFRPAMGPGMVPGPRGGPGGPPVPGPGSGSGPGGVGPPGGMGSRGMELSPLVGVNDKTKPLRSRLLAVPKWREQYLRNVAEVADQLNWKNLGPVVARYRDSIEEEVAADTRKLASLADFRRSTADGPGAAAQEPANRRPPLPSLREFADRRRAYLLSVPELKQALEPKASIK